MTAKAFVFPHGPSHQNTVQMVSDDLKLRTAKAAVVPLPATIAWRDQTSQIIERGSTFQVQAPMPDRLPHRFLRRAAYRWGKADEHFAMLINS